MIERLGGLVLTALLVATLAVLWTGPQGSPTVLAGALVTTPEVPVAEPGPGLAPNPVVSPGEAPISAQETAQDAPRDDPPPTPPPVATEVPKIAPGPWVPALVGPQPGVAYTPGGWVCWSEYGYPLPQTSPTCPPGWGGRPPENPTPIGTPSRLP